jgi:sec-independent protein translocase protein TatA
MSSTFGGASLVLGQPWEWIILLIIIALLLLFGPSKLPEFARSIGRAMGEFRRGKEQVEREIRQELAHSEGAEVGAGRDQIFRAARELSVPTEGRDLKDVKLDVARAIDRVEPTVVVAVARMFGLPVEGVSGQSLKEQIIRRLQV